MSSARHPRAPTTAEILHARYALIVAPRVDVYGAVLGLSRVSRALWLDSIIASLEHAPVAFSVQGSGRPPRSTQSP